MFCVALISGFNILVLLAPPDAVSNVLTLMRLPVVGRYALLMAAVVNIGISVAFEEWGAPNVSKVVGSMIEWWRRRSDGKIYKVVEGGMAT